MSFHHLNPWIATQAIKSKAIPDYYSTGKCVLRDCVKSVSVNSLIEQANLVSKRSWIGIFNQDNASHSRRSMHKATPLGDAVMSELHQLAKQFCLIDQDRLFCLSRGSTFLKSAQGCEQQQRHRDYFPFDIVRRKVLQYQKPASCLVALKNETSLHFFYGPDKVVRTVTLNAGDAVIFAGDALHAGAAWTASDNNFRLFAYWPTEEFFVDWQARNATAAIDVTKFIVSADAAADLAGITNPMYTAFVEEEFKKFLYDFTTHTYYRFDSKLYLEGIGAAIDGYGGEVYESAYVVSEIKQIARAHGKCPHFPKDALPAMDPKQLHACVRRCFYCQTACKRLRDEQ